MSSRLPCRRSWESHYPLKKPCELRASFVSPSTDLLRQLDDNPRWAAHVAKPVDALVVHKLAYQLAAMRAQLCEGFLDVVDGEEDVADAWGVSRDRRGIAPVRGGAGLGLVGVASLPLPGAPDSDRPPPA